MNLDIQPNNINIIINAASIEEAIGQLVRAKVALRTMIVPAPLSEEALRALLAELAERLPLVPAPDAREEDTEPEQGAVAQETAAERESGPEQRAEEMEPAPAKMEEQTDTAELPPLADLQAECNQTGQALFGEEWTQASPWLVKRYTSKFTADQVRDRLSKLTAREVADLITRLVENAAAFQTAWAEQKPTPQPKSKRKTAKRSAAQQANHEQMAHPANVVMATG